MPVIVDLHGADKQILGELRTGLHVGLSEAHSKGALDLVRLRQDRVALEDLMVAVLRVWSLVGQSGLSDIVRDLISTD